jgi:hypothetical protein
MINVSHGRIAACVLPYLMCAVATADQSSLVQDFRKIAQTLDGLSVEMIYPSSKFLDGWFPQAPVDVRVLIQRAHELPEGLLKSESAKERALAAVVFCLCDDPGRVGAAAQLLTDKTPSLNAWVLRSTFPGGFPEQKPVHHFVREALALRLIGPKGPWFVTAAGWTGPDTSLGEYWGRIKNPKELPSEWMFRLRKAKWAGEDYTRIKSELAKVGRPARAFIMAAVLNETRDWEDTPFAIHEVVEELRASLDRTELRAVINGTRKIPGMEFPYGPNMRDAAHIRGFILRYAPKLLSPEDAEWLTALAKRSADDEEDVMRNAYAMGAARLDPKRADEVLRRTIEKETSGSARIPLLMELWDRSTDRGPVLIAYLVDEFYGKGRKDENRGERRAFQVLFVSRFVREFGSGARSVLAGVIRDGRFVGLGWTVLRAFAQPAAVEIVAGKNPAEAKSVHSVRHPLRPEEFDDADPAARASRRRETDRVLEALTKFREYLIAAATAVSAEPKGR